MVAEGRPIAYRREADRSQSAPPRFVGLMDGNVRHASLDKLLL